MNLKAHKTPFIVPKTLLNTSELGHNSSTIPWILDYAYACGYQEILLPPIDWQSESFQAINKMAFERNLKPIHLINIDDFVLIKNLPDWVSQGVHFSILIYQPLHAAFLNRLKEMKAHLSHLHFILIPRKDWNFSNTFKSLPQMIRERLSIDFPMKLNESDPFYSPEEIEKIESDMGKNFTNFKSSSFFPHYHFYQEYLQFRLESVTVNRIESKEFLLSIITTDVDIAKRLQKIKGDPSLFEIVLTRFKNQNHQSVVDDSSNITKIWVGTPGEGKKTGESLSYLRNLSAMNSQGRYLIFAKQENFEEVKKLVEKLPCVLDQSLPNLDKAKTLFVEKSHFLKLGGFDPLYGSFRLAELELFYKIWKRSEKWDEDFQFILEKKKNSLSPLERNFGARLFYQQYKDINLYQQLADNSFEIKSKKDRLKMPMVSQQTQYRLIRIKDAYFSLYKATPKVAIEGNLKFLWSFILPYLKKFYYNYIHKFYFEYIHRFYFDYIHKFYYMVFNLCHKLWLLMSRSFYLLHTFYFRYIHKAYHKAYLAVNKLYYKYIHGGYFFIHKLYYKYVFTALFPVRKVYYFSRYQYEKRVLGLHVKNKVLARGGKN